MANLEKRKRIREALKELLKNNSQSQLAIKAQVSTALMSQILSGNDKLITNEKYEQIKINLKIDWRWKTARTFNYIFMQSLLKESQENATAIAISYNAGAGKSHTYRSYERENKNVIYVEAKHFWSKKSFIAALLRSIGKQPKGTCEVLIEQFLNEVKKMVKPILIIDQADKLKDNQLDLFMDFYNEMEGHCGFVLSGVPALEKRIERGCQLNRIGYKEIFSRIGRRFIALRELTRHDVAEVCRANGL